MNIIPTGIWEEGKLSLKRNGVEGDGYVEQNFYASKAHESNESIVSDVAAVR